MSAQSGWYPDPGGGQDLYRFWDGKAWSAATSPNPSAPPPVLGPLGGPPAQPLGAQPQAGQSTGGQPYGAQGTGGQPYAGQPAYGSAYAQYQQTQQKKSPVGWWLAGAALVLVIVVVAVIAIRAATGAGGSDPLPNLPGGQSTSSTCPNEDPSPSISPDPNDGRVHGGPVSMPELGSPWSPPRIETRVPFGTDAKIQSVTDQEDYDGTNSWVASVLVAELQAGDGFFSPEQGSAIVVKCILGSFYADAPVTSDVKVNEAATIDGQEGWIVESQLSFDIPGLRAKGELLIVAIVSAGATSGLFYASVPDTQPELVGPARQALADLLVDG